MQNKKLSSVFDGIEFIENSIDNHVHCCPHLNSRSVNIFQAVREAINHKMKGIGFMDNFSNSAGYAAVVNEEFKNLQIDVFGGLIMEPYAGGVNVDALKVGLNYNYGDKKNTRFVSLPTHHTRNIALQENRSPKYLKTCLSIPEKGPIPDPLPEIIDLIIENDVVFNTGHLSGNESLKLVDFANKRGLKRILVPSSHFENEIVKEIAKLNCFLEFSYLFISNATEIALTHIDEEKHKSAPVKIEKMKELINIATVNKTILSSDCGLSILPNPVKGFAKFLSIINNQGFSEDEIRIMSSYNSSMLFNINNTNVQK